MVVIKEHAPYTPDLEQDVLLNPMARTIADKEGSFSFPKVLQTTKPKSDNAAIAQKLIGAATAGTAGVGSDVELISSFNIDNQTFLDRNFTVAEQDYCRAASDPRASFCVRWAAK